MQIDSLSPTSEGLIAKQTSRQIFPERPKFVQYTQSAGSQFAPWLDSGVSGRSLALDARLARERAQPEGQVLFFGGRPSESADLQGLHRLLTRQNSCKPYKLRGILDAFVNTCQRWGLNEHDQTVLLGFNPGDIFGRQVLNGRIRALSRDVEDRAGYVIAISLGLGILFGERVDAENQWMKSPRKSLDDQSPLNFILNGKMENLLRINRMVEQERGL